MIEGWMRTRDGSDRAMLWSTVLLQGVEGEAAGALTVGSDITDRITAERARDRAIEELEELKEQLEEALLGAVRVLSRANQVEVVRTADSPNR